MLFYCSVCSVSRFTICDIYSNRRVKVSYIDMCVHTYEERHVQTHVHMDTHTSGLSVRLWLVHYFPLAMNRPAAVWSLWLPPNQTVIQLGDGSGRVERQGKLFHFGQAANVSLRLNDPADSECQNVPQQPPPIPPPTPIFPRSPQILYFSFLYRLKKPLHLSS